MILDDDFFTPSKPSSPRREKILCFALVASLLFGGWCKLNGKPKARER